MAHRISRRALMLNAAALSSLAACGTVSQPVEQALSAPSDALGDLDATGVAARVRAGEVTAAEALEAAIARAERVQPQLNFMSADAYDYGRALAATPRSGPLAGVPTLIKDLMGLEGAPLRYGSRAFVNNVTAENPPYVEALQTAGLVPFGKSTTPEFGFTATTEPLQGGVTRNPWDVTRSSGGSSGGAGVAVAARVVPIAHASDGGGSIRIPASCNGLVGLKYSRGRDLVSAGDTQPMALSVNGCVSRSVRDTAAWLAITEAQSGGAHAPVGMVSGPNRRRLRIALRIEDGIGRDPAPDVRAATEAAAALCRSLGHEVRDAYPEIDGAAFAQAFTFLWAAGAAEVVAEVSQAASGAPLDQLLEPLTLELAQHFQREGGEAQLRPAIATLRAAEAAYAAFFADADVLLTPVLGDVPPVLGEISPALGMAGFERVSAYVGYTPVQNVAGAPAISLPLGWSSGGLPIGAHFSAAPGQERTLLELAYELEQAQPWAARKPPVNAA